MAMICLSWAMTTAFRFAVAGAGVVSSGCISHLMIVDGGNTRRTSPPAVGEAAGLTDDEFNSADRNRVSYAMIGLAGREKPGAHHWRDGGCA
jgi:hypothetical protein